MPAGTDRNPRHGICRLSAAMKGPRKLSECHNIMDLRALAGRRLPSPIFHYLDGAADDEVTARDNTAAFEREKLIPRYLIDVAKVSTITRILGQEVAWPVFCSPTGSSRFYHPEGELAVARAAAKAGTFYSLSTMSSHSLEDVAAASSGPKMFQLYVFKDRGVTREMIDRCKQAGFQALCLTIDVPVRGKRERELRSGMGVPMKLSARSVASFALRPRWVAGWLNKGPLSLPNFAARAGSDRLVPQTRFVAEQLDPSVAWDDVGEMIERWGGPFAIKGILSAPDAKRAQTVGATAVIVSNHGGRQLDGVPATIEALPDIVDAVADKLEVILDGGVRRGTHVLKALALGAKACTVGRPYLYGLAAGGEAGVAKALNILRTELVRAMQLTGCTSIRTIDRALVRRF